MFLGIEIGGTKLQLGVGAGDGSSLVDVCRSDVEPRRGASGILEQIDRHAAALLQRHSIERIGIGFGGPVDPASGRIVKSHQIDGWEDVHLVEWCRTALSLPAVLGNDCDAAALAEARFGAGRDKRIVFYVTVGTGVGGGLVVDGKLYGAGRPAVAEIGHLRPGLHHDRPDDTVESLASGWGIVAAAQARLSGQIARPLELARGSRGPLHKEAVRQRLADARQADDEYASDLLARCAGDPEALTSKMVAEAAAEGNEIAREVFQHSVHALGWAIAQAITLVAPEVVVVGGGVSLAGEQLFFTPLREAVGRYVFGPLTRSYAIAPAALGELAVVHGALALAAE